MKAPQNNLNINFIVLLNNLVVQNGRGDGGINSEHYINDLPIKLGKCIIILRRNVAQEVNK